MLVSKRLGSLRREVTEMVKHDRMQKVVLGTLAVMMVASLILTTAVLAAPLAEPTPAGDVGIEQWGECWCPGIHCPGPQRLLKIWCRDWDDSIHIYCVPFCWN